ncbi:hypothetical protein QYM36_006663 [Artemia franciscana]|uniref:DDE-1 domain-containing protein n=1 Tax=Artemia franciscana TaxID=6661 RepID=A0AA88IAX1_ARTSF|nr:hypothetical protein QYM36_006663 [Artemia franciscana]
MTIYEIASLVVVQFAKESGITLLTIPPHCSHRLQPLDICVYFPFKCQYNKAMDNWMQSNPGKTPGGLPSRNGESLPVSLQPYPKAKPRELSGRGKKKGSRKILTDTPVERKIEEQEAKIKDKKAWGGRARGKLGIVERAGKAKKD